MEIIISLHGALHFKNKTFRKYYIKENIHWGNLINYSSAFVTRQHRQRDRQCPYIQLQVSLQIGCVANTFAAPKGLVFTTDNPFRLICSGGLKAANVSWISVFLEEPEFIMLPTQFEIQKKIANDNEDYKDWFRDTANIHLYESRVYQRNCILQNIQECADKVQSVQTKWGIETKWGFALVQRSKYDQFWNGCCHLLSEHEEYLQDSCGVSSELIVQDLSRCGVDIEPNASQDLRKFLLYFMLLHVLLPFQKHLSTMESFTHFHHGLLHITKDIKYQQKIELYNGLLLVDFLVTFLLTFIRKFRWIFGIKSRFGVQFMASLGGSYFFHYAYW